VPDAPGVDADVFERADRVAVAVRAAELDDGDRHADHLEWAAAEPCR